MNGYYTQKAPQLIKIFLFAESGCIRITDQTTAIADY